MNRLLPLPLAVAAALTLAGCRGPAVAPPAGNVITGTVTYQQRVALPPDAVLEVQLLDVARPEAPAEVLNTVTISPLGPVPVFFKLSYNPTQIQPTHIYVLRARITAGGRLRFINATAARVLTDGYPTDRALVLDLADER